MVFFRHIEVRVFSLVHVQVNWKEITCPEQQKYDSDNADNWFRHPWKVWSDLKAVWELVYKPEAYSPSRVKAARSIRNV